MTTEPSNRVFSPEELAALQAKLRDFKGDQAWTRIAEQVGIPFGTISVWAGGKYTGDNHRIAATIERFFAGQAEKQELAAALPTDPGFQPTQTARRILTCLAMAQLGDMAAIATPPGVGKTACLEHYRGTRAQVWLIPASPAIGSLPSFLVELAAKVGAEHRKGTPQVLTRSIRDRVVRTGGLIVVDEAQELSRPALEELRAIHDETKIGVALVGDENLIVNLRKFPQLFSRLGIKHTQRGATREDIAAIAKAWGVQAAAELNFLAEIGGKPGATRNLVKTLKLAAHVAASSGAPLTVADLQDAWAQRNAAAETA